MREFEGIVVGAGLAGCACARRFAPGRVLLVDRGDADTASSVAAGLVTPVTGKRLALADGIAELLPAADTCYRAAEAATGIRFWHPAPTVRHFTTADERTRFYRKADQFAAWVGELPADLRGEFGGFAMPGAMRLDVPAYLAATRREYAVELADLSADDIAVSPTRVTVPKLNAAAGWIVFCLGPNQQPLAPALVFEPAKGDVLTLLIPAFDGRFVRNRAGTWLVPLGADRFLFGATYDRTGATGPTAAGRDELLAKLPAFGVKDYTIESHRAAARPVLPKRKPALGWSDAHPNVGHLTGLGSKGVLTAPTLAKELFARRDLPDLAALAHATLDALLERGDVAVDATAGNGHDTVFLAARCRHVHAFDIQDAAERATLARAANSTNVTFHRRCHSTMAQHVAGPVGAVVFNLGYLPTADRTVVTRAETTVPAVRAATALLRPGGVLCVLAYRGHPGGADELAAVRAVFSTLPGWSATETATPGPVLLIGVKPSA